MGWPPKGRVSAPSLAAAKEARVPVVALTAYDYPMARMLDSAGVDVLLVGDSLGMVVLGFPDTLSVTMDDMVRHSAAVARGAQRSLVVADMPFLSYQAEIDEAIRNAGRLLSEGGAGAVKVEGAGSHSIRVIERLVETGIPVMGHIGLTPQSVKQFGGFHRQGTDESSAERIAMESESLESAGVFAIVLESVPAPLAARISRSLSIPTIGIGAGPGCDGQILVTTDILGTGGPGSLVPPFARRYAELGEQIIAAARSYSDDVRSKVFPEAE